MSYKIKAKTRKIKKYCLHLIDIMNFSHIQFSLGEKVIFISSVGILFWMFGKWIDDTEWIVIKNAFSSHLGNIGYVMLLCILMIFFLLFSMKQKEKIKNLMSISVKKRKTVKIIWIIIFLFVIFSGRFIASLQTFYSSIIYGTGYFLSLSSSCLLMIGVLIAHYSKNTAHTPLCANNSQYKEKEEDKKNMKLPF